MNKTLRAEKRQRIETKGIRAHDIRELGLLTREEIATIDPSIVFGWVKTGQWTTNNFRRYLNCRDTMTKLERREYKSDNSTK